jgi:uncharacterized damage-inducible protein DinB
MIDVDRGWFEVIRGLPRSPKANPIHLPHKEEIRRRWDEVQATMRAYLGDLRDEMLGGKPVADLPMALWQILLQVVNHGTDHRAQLLALLHHLGVETFPQDYFFFLRNQK